MKRVSTVCAAIGIILLALGCSGGEEPQEAAMKLTPSEVFITKIIERLDHTRTILADMAEPADAAAERIVAGGSIFVMDDETISRTGEEEVKMMPGGGYQYPMHEDWGGFVAEACDRAGGLRHIQPVPLSGDLTDKDVVIVGTLDLHPDDQYTQLKSYKDNGALIIVFGSKESRVSQLADYLVDNGLPTGLSPVMDVGSGTPVGPTAGIANVINMWVFIAEYVAAVTRQGEMPTLWQSMFVPGAAQRNEKIGEYMFHPDMRIMPIEPGILGLQYITEVKGFLVKIKANERDKFPQAGSLMAETVASGNKIVGGVIGHFMTSQRRMPSFPKDLFTIIENEYGADPLRGVLEKGDTWFHIGYSMYPERELKYAREVGASTVAVFTPGPTDIGEGLPVPIDYSLIDVYINPYWQHGDAVVEVPDYDTKILPPSGVVMSTCYWMLIGETLAAQNR